MIIVKNRKWQNGSIPHTCCQNGVYEELKLVRGYQRNKYITQDVHPREDLDS